MTPKLKHLQQYEDFAKFHENGSVHNINCMLLNQGMDR
jgi:hypothetical protein